MSEECKFLGIEPPAPLLHITVREGDVPAQSCIARETGLDEETSDTPMSQWLPLGTSVRKKVSEVKSGLEPWNQRKEWPHGPRTRLGIPLCFRDVGLMTRRLTAICLPSHILVNMETVQNHSKVTEPFPHRGTELCRHSQAHMSALP